MNTATSPEQEAKLSAFGRLLESDQLHYLILNGLDCQANRDHAKVSIKSGQKYVKVDVGNSGKYMVEMSTDTIFGIKGYGVIHRGHQFGTLDTINDFYWGGYRASRK